MGIFSSRIIADLGTIDTPQTNRLDPSQLRVPNTGYGVDIPRVYGGPHKLEGYYCTIPDITQTVDHYVETVDYQIGDYKHVTKTPVYTYANSFTVFFCEGDGVSMAAIYVDGVRYAAGLGGSFNTGDKGGIEQTGYSGALAATFTGWKSDNLPSIQADVYGSDVTYQDVCESVCAECGLDSADYDFSMLTGTIAGWIRQGRSTGRQLLEILQRIGFFDFTQIDGKLTALVRGSDPAVSITSYHLGAKVENSRSPQSVPARVPIVLKSGLDIPGHVEVDYRDPSQNYEQSVQWADNAGDDNNGTTDSISTPAIMTSTHAATVAAVDIADQDASDGEATVTLPPQYMILPAGCPVLVPSGEGTLRMRVIRNTFGTPGPATIDLRTEDASVFALTGSGVEGTGGGDDTDESGDAPASDFDAWSLPLISASDGELPGFYVVASGPLHTWRGSTVYWAVHGSGNWIKAGGLGVRGTFGVSTSALADWSDPSTEDASNDVDLALVSPGTLASVSTADRAAGASRCLLGLEILSFKTVTGTYTLDHLLRGQLSSVMTGHSSGDRFVRLNGAVLRVPVSSELVGETLDVICVSPGETIGTQTPVEVLIHPASPPYVTPDEIDSSPGYRRDFLLMGA